MIALGNTPDQDFDLPGVDIDDLDLPTVTANFDLDIEFQELDGALYGALTYNTDLFDTITIQRMISHLQTLLTAIAEDAEHAIHALPMLTPAETQQLLVEWNDTALEV